MVYSQFWRKSYLWLVFVVCLSHLQSENHVYVYRVYMLASNTETICVCDQNASPGSLSCGVTCLDLLEVFFGCPAPLCSWPLFRVREECTLALRDVLGHVPLVLVDELSLWSCTLALPSQQSAAPLDVRRLFAALGASAGSGLPHRIPCLRCTLLGSLDAREAYVSVLRRNSLL